MQFEQINLIHLFYDSHDDFIIKLILIFFMGLKSLGVVTVQKKKMKEEEIKAEISYWEKPLGTSRLLIRHAVTVMKPTSFSCAAIRCVWLEAVLCRPSGVWHQSTARAIRKDLSHSVFHLYMRVGLYMPIWDTPIPIFSFEEKHTPTTHVSCQLNYAASICAWPKISF